MLKKIFNKLIVKKRKKKNNINFFSIFKKEKKFKRRLGYKLKINLFKKNKFIFKNKLTIKISLFLVLFGLLFIVFGPLLRVNKIEIIRKDYLTNIDIAYKSVDFIRGTSMFTVNFNTIKNKLKAYQINIKDIDIKLSFPDLIRIEIGSYTGLFNIKIHNKNYIITKNGVFIPMKRYSEIKDIEIVYNKLLDIPILDYKKVLSDKYLYNIDYLINSLEDNIINITIDNIVYYKKERELHIFTKSGVRLIYDLDADIDSQIKATAILNKQYYKISDGGISYIDFRIKDKIYYCSNEIRQLCLSHMRKIYNK